MEAPLSGEPLREPSTRRRRESREQGTAGEEEEDPFDSIRSRSKRRGGMEGSRQDSIARSAPSSSEASTRVVREAPTRVERAHNAEKSQSTSAISHPAEHSLSPMGVVNCEDVGSAHGERRRRSGGEEEEELVAKRLREESVKKSQGGGEGREVVSENGDSRSAVLPPRRQEKAEAEASGETSRLRGTATEERGGWDPQLPRNRLQVVVVPLLRRTQPPARRGGEARGPLAARNFKTFRKVSEGMVLATR